MPCSTKDNSPKSPPLHDGSICVVSKYRLLIGTTAEAAAFLSTPADTVLSSGDCTLPRLRRRYLVCCVSAPEPMPWRVDPCSSNRPTSSGSLPKAASMSSLSSPRVPGSNPLTPDTSTSPKVVSTSGLAMNAARTADDYILKLMERRKQATQRPAVVATSAVSTDNMTDVASSSMPRGSTCGSSKPPRESAAQQDEAREAERVRARAAHVLGEDHVHRCTLASDSLNEAGVRAAVEFIDKALHSSMEEGDGRSDVKGGRPAVFLYGARAEEEASTLAIWYLITSSSVTPRVSLTKATSEYVPRALPRMSHVHCLMHADPGKKTFDATRYAESYLSRKHPQKDLDTVQAALAIVSGDIAKAEQLILNDLFFKSTTQRTDKLMEVQRRMTSELATVEGSSTQSILSSINASFSTVHTTSDEAAGVVGSRSPRGLGGEEEAGRMERLSPVAADLADRSAAAAAASKHSSLMSRQVRQYADSTPSSFSIASSGSQQPLVLTGLDDDMIEAITKALVEGGTRVTQEKVRDSYVRHRRRKDRVLRDFLFPSDSGPQERESVNMGNTRLATFDPHLSTPALSNQAAGLGVPRREGRGGGASKSLGTPRSAEQLTASDLTESPVSVDSAVH